MIPVVFEVAGLPFVSPPLLWPGTIPDGPPTVMWSFVTSVGGGTFPSPRETGVVADVSMISAIVIVVKNVVCKRLLLSRRQGDKSVCGGAAVECAFPPANKKGRHFGGYLPSLERNKHLNTQLQVIKLVH